MSEIVPPEWTVVEALLPHAKPKVRRELAKALRKAVRAEVREMANLLQVIVRKDVADALNVVYTERSALETGVQSLVAIAEKMQVQPKQLPPPPEESPPAEA